MKLSLNLNSRMEYLGHFVGKFSEMMGGALDCVTRKIHIIFSDKNFW